MQGAGEGTQRCGSGPWLAWLQWSPGMLPMEGVGGCGAMKTTPCRDWGEAIRWEQGLGGGKAREEISNPSQTQRCPRGGSPPSSPLEPDSSWLYPRPVGCSIWGKGSGLMGVDPGAAWNCSPHPSKG